jgi:hypothetical protein
MAKKQLSLPANRAFVVQLHAEAQPEQGQFRGRVEHLVSYQSAHFASVTELTAFMVWVLTADTHDTATTGTEGKKLGGNYLLWLSLAISASASTLS